MAICGKLDALKLRFGAQMAIWSEAGVDLARGGGRRSVGGEGDAGDRSLVFSPFCDSSISCSNSSLPAVNHVLQI